MFISKKMLIHQQRVSPQQKDDEYSDMIYGEAQSNEIHKEDTSVTKQGRWMQTFFFQVRHGITMLGVSH